MEEEAALGHAMVEKTRVMAALSKGTGLAGYLGVVWVVHMITKQGNKGDPGANTVKPRKALGTKSWPTC